MKNTSSSGSVKAYIKMTPKQCLNAAMMFAPVWKIVAAHLGFNFWEIDAIDQECIGSSMLWKTTMMLTKWTQREVDNANLSNLMCSLKALKIV